jgi:hypothetical protein
VSSRFAVPLVIGLAVVVAIVLGVLWIQRGAHVELKGDLLKIRTHELDETSSIAVIDFRFVNPADYPFIVRRVDVILEDMAGRTLDGMIVAEADTQRLFDAYPLLGQKFNESLLPRDRVEARESQDRMIAARFEVPVAVLNGRKKFTVRVEDVDGPVSEIHESK